MFRGNYPARIDDKGRLKIPSEFRGRIGEQGPTLFVTSVEGDCVRLYPMSEWEEVEKRMASMPSSHPARRKFADRVNYYGQTAEVDAQGRVLIHQLLREAAGMNGEVLVVGNLTYLEVWNRQRFENTKIHGNQLTNDDYEQLAAHGI